MKIETLNVQGFAEAMGGMRAPLKSYDKSDTTINNVTGSISIGPNDRKLALSLGKGGTEHRKYLRQIWVWADIYAPRFGWSEWDTYRVGVSANSESTMHRLIKDGIKKEDLDFDGGVDSVADNAMENLLFEIEMLIDHYEKSNKETQEKIFPLIKGLVPESFLQKRTVCLNYEVLATMYRQRQHHRLPQWNTDFTNGVRTLPFNELITGEWDD